MKWVVCSECDSVVMDEGIEEDVDDCPEEQSRGGGYALYCPRCGLQATFMETD